MNGSQKFYSSLLLLIILNLVIKPVWILGIDRQVQNTVGLQVYGQYFSLFNLSIITGFLLDWGMTTYYSRQLSRKNTFMNLAGEFLTMKIALVIIYAFVIIVIAYVSGVRNWSILTGVICIQALTSFFLFFRAMITARQMFRVDAWLSVFDKSLMILLCGALLLFPATFGYMTIGKFIFFQVTCLGLAILIAAFILVKAGFRFDLGSISFFKRSTIKTMLPYALIILVMSLHYRLYGFLLERLRPDGAYQAGLYASAYRLLDASNMVGFLFASFLLPYVARWSDDPLGVSSVTLNIRHVLVVFSLGIACTGIFLAPWMQNILYHNNNSESIEVLKWCLPALIGYSFVHIYGTLLTATGHILPFCLITFIAVAVNLVLNIFLIPLMGAKGSCIAALVSQSACGIATMYYAKEKLGIPIHKDSLFIYIVIGGAVGLLFYWGGNSNMDISLLLVVAIVTTILIMIITKLFRPSLWMQLFSKSQTGS